jgi:K+/H+ antiporter YhaU regulatory subunit KhtT
MNTDELSGDDVGKMAQEVTDMAVNGDKWSVQPHRKGSKIEMVVIDEDGPRIAEKLTPEEAHKMAEMMENMAREAGVRRSRL